MIEAPCDGSLESKVDEGSGCKHSIFGSEAGWKENAAQSRLDTRMASTH